MKLGLGTVQFGQAYGVSGNHGQVPREDVRAILARAAANGVHLLDTAANYGEAEAVLGELDTTAFRIVTKTTHLSKGLDVVLERVRQSARTLRNADTLLVHMADDLIGDKGDAFWATLQSLKSEGLFRKIGISAYVAQKPAMLAERFRPDVMQVPFSLLDQRLLIDGSLERLKALNVEIHARSIFLQGLLFLERLPEKLRYAEPRLASIRNRIREARSTPLAASLCFIATRPEIDVALVGVAEDRQLAEILKTLAAPPTELDWHQLAVDDELLLTPSRW